MRTVLLLSVAWALARADCVAVSSDQILAGDLSDAVPFLRQLKPNTPLGFSPLPGTQRVFWTRELALIAESHGFSVTTSGGALPSVCVERAVRPISIEQMNAALVTGLSRSDAELELVEFSRQPVPAGKLEFKRAGLNRPPLQAPDAAVLWRGRLIYDDRRSAMVWARVKISVDQTLLVAAQDIGVGTVITAQEIKEIHERQFPFVEPSPAVRADIIGKRTRRLIPAGQKLAPGSLEPVKDIFSGDQVRVSVIDGSTTLSLDAIAQSSGKRGESILVHNPSSGKNFHGVIEEKGRVTVRPSPGA
jgi:flagella basal body P-ring formation protein FlgA